MAQIEAFLGLSSADINLETGNNPTVGSAMTTEINLSRNTDSFYFDFFVDSGDYGDTGWTNTGVTDLDRGTHEVSFVVFNSNDDTHTSALYVDHFQFL